MTSPWTRALALSGCVALTLHGACTPRAEDTAPALVLALDATSLPADGRSSLSVRASLSPTARAAVDGPLVVRFQASAGWLTATTASLDDDGAASTRLFAATPDALLGASSRVVTVRASAVIDDDHILEATATFALVVPEGVPILTIVPADSALVADGVSSTTLSISLLNASAAHVVELSSTHGTLATSTLTLVEGDVGARTGEATLVSPSLPAQATVIARLASDGASPPVEARAIIDFVDENGPQFDLTGTFAELAIARVKMSAGTLTPNPQCAVAPSILKIDVVQDGDRVTMTHTPCRVTLPAVHTVAGTVTTETPPAFIAALPVVTDETTLASRALGAPLVPPESLVVVGAELDDPRTDPLPTSPDDERVRDDDGDGEPGVTVMSSLGGEQHATYRNRGQILGRIASSNRIDGSVLGELVAVTETSVLGVGNGFLPTTTPLPGVFEMVRVDGTNGAIDVDTDGDGVVTCAEILDAEQALFTLETPSTPTGCQEP